MNTNQSIYLPTASVAPITFSLIDVKSGMSTGK